VKYSLPKFSHIYIEKGARGYPLTDLALSKFHRSTIIDIDHYKDIFNRSNQDFQSQKDSMKLILAKKSTPFIYPISDMVQEYSTKNVFYNTPILNCLYNCDYCFLQGMYPSGNIVIFVNESDFMDTIDKKLEKFKDSKEMMAVSVSYNTDLLAMENLLPITKNWIEYASQRKNLIIEIRTKSSLFSSIKNIKPNDNVILSWTISPQTITELYEKNTPPTIKRIRALKAALDKGWKVRLCFDPVIIVKNWQEIYPDFFTYVFQNIDSGKLYDITLGVFRMNKDYFNRIRKRNPKSDIFYSDYSIEDNTVVPYKKNRIEVLEYLKKELANYFDLEKILIWE
tara:strand:+ start:690 stop:1706 length:1017 start_codon:yes stop_codon:yes gene_type:complete